jgi:hypothetical protein
LGFLKSNRKLLTKLSLRTGRSVVLQVLDRWRYTSAGLRILLVTNLDLQRCAQPQILAVATTLSGDLISRTERLNGTYCLTQSVLHVYPGDAPLGSGDIMRSNDDSAELGSPLEIIGILLSRCRQKNSEPSGTWKTMISSEEGIRSTGAEPKFAGTAAPNSRAEPATSEHFV